MFQLENSSKIKVWWTLYAIDNIIAEYESKFAFNNTTVLER